MGLLCIDMYLLQWAIQIIRDILGRGWECGVRDSVTKCHKGTEGVSHSATWHISKILNHILPYFFDEKRWMFEYQNVTSHQGGGGVCVRTFVTKWHMGEGGGLKKTKKCHVFFEWPLTITIKFDFNLYLIKKFHFHYVDILSLEN